MKRQEAGDVTLGRTKMWAAALKFFKSNAVFGIGWEQIRHRTIWQLNIHNIYIQLLAETGIIGFLFFVSFFIYILVRSIRLLSQMKMTTNVRIGVKLWFSLFLCKCFFCCMDLLVTIV